MPCASLWMYSVTKNTTGMKRPRITARNAANDTSRPIVPPSEEGGFASAWLFYPTAELRDGGGGDGGEACDAGGASRLLWLLAGVATGGLCFGAGIAVERRRLLTRRPRPASSTGTAPLLDLPEHNKP